jgi:hypothetical protein
MAGTLTFRIEDQASPDLTKLIAEVRNVVPALTAAGRGVANLLRDHFAELDASRPNRMGWERQHFWNEIRGSVNNPVVTGAGAEVSIDHVALRQKIEGGPIAPVHGQFLTLPAVEEAYGKRAREFSGLKFAIVEDPESGHMRPALVAQRGVATVISRGPRAKHYKAVAEHVGVIALFWLVRRVVQAPTEGALPEYGELNDAAYSGAEEWAAAMLGRMETN